MKIKLRKLMKDFIIPCSIIFLVFTAGWYFTGVAVVEQFPQTQLIAGE